jgi:hypothetical protein
MRTFILFCLLLGVVGGGIAQAAEIEKFFMPGELIAGHDKFKSECTNCHVRLRDTTQNKLCLDCHDHQTVAEDIASKQGFHGKDENARTQECKACHSDHKGRDATVVWLDRDTFDHRFTDYELIGRHKLTECSGCHLEDKKYRQAEHGCYDCHSEDDAHDGDLGKECDSCHNPVGWSQFEFDHDQTEFKLKFSHQRVNCNACHVKEQYKDTPKNCVDCHAIRDVHANRFGNQCESCHQEKAWDKTIFDHDRDTDYRLEARHRGPSCNDCHKPGYAAKKKKDTIRDCYSCHRDDDPHNELNGKKCQDCHVVRGWAYAEFDHGANTDFALNGAHDSLACEACHDFGASTKEIDTDCYSCHKQDDVHKREQGIECNQCHKEVAWLKHVRFDHDLSKFPLIGQHAAAGCEACHLTSVFQDTGSHCIDCHESDDVHKRGLGKDCALCHNPNDWLIWAFDHDETDFELRHAHSEVHCHSCHYRPLEEVTDRGARCVDCHRRDDIHDGNFGGNCSRCHGEESFEAINIQSLEAFSRKTAIETGE